MILESYKNIEVLWDHLAWLYSKTLSYFDPVLASNCKMHRSYSGTLSCFTRKLQWLTFQLSKSQLPFSYMVHQYTSTQPVDTVSADYINNVQHQMPLSSDADDKGYSPG